MSGMEGEVGLSYGEKKNKKNGQLNCGSYFRSIMKH